MRRILIISLSVHWTVVFGIMAVSASAMPVFKGQFPLVTSAGAMAYAVAAVLFLWTTVSAFVSRGLVGEVRGIARAAFATAALALTLAIMVAHIGSVPQAVSLATMQLAALGATYLVIRVEDAEAASKRAEPDYSHAVARRMAVGAAHSSMLMRLSGRRPNILETET